MSNEPTTEFDETIELSEKDQQDLASLMPEEVEYHTLLEVWRELLAGSVSVAKEKVQPAWASRITTLYPQVKMQQMKKFHDQYFGHLEELRNILLLEIGSDKDALKFDSAEDDLEANSHHYKNLLLQWQLAITQWEMDWDCVKADSAVTLAAISEVHKLFFSAEGIVAYLDNVGFQFTDDDAATLQSALEELRAGE